GTPVSPDEHDDERAALQQVVSGNQPPIGVRQQETGQPVTGSSRLPTDADVVHPGDPFAISGSCLIVEARDDPCASFSQKSWISRRPTVGNPVGHIEILKPGWRWYK